MNPPGFSWAQADLQVHSARATTSLRDVMAKSAILAKQPAAMDCARQPRVPMPVVGGFAVGVCGHRGCAAASLSERLSLQAMFSFEVNREPSCSAHAGHPVRRGFSNQSLTPPITGSPAFADDDGGGCDGVLRVFASASEAIHLTAQRKDGLLRGACHRARIRATRWLAMTARDTCANSYAIFKQLN
jgi:hypothetical protein